MVDKTGNLLIMLNNLLQVHLKLLPKEQFKESVEATGDLIWNKAVAEFTKVGITLSQNKSETAANVDGVLGEIYISLEKVK